MNPGSVLFAIGQTGRLGEMPLLLIILTLILKTRPIFAFRFCYPPGGCLYLGATADCPSQTAFQRIFAPTRAT